MRGGSWRGRTVHSLVGAVLSRGGATARALGSNLRVLPIASAVPPTALSMRASPCLAECIPVHPPRPPCAPSAVPYQGYDSRCSQCDTSVRECAAPGPFAHLRGAVARAWASALTYRITRCAICGQNAARCGG